MLAMLSQINSKRKTSSGGYDHSRRVRVKGAEGITLSGIVMANYEIPATSRSERGPVGNLSIKLNATDATREGRHHRLDENNIIHLKNKDGTEVMLPGNRIQHSVFKDVVVPKVGEVVTVPSIRINDRGYPTTGAPVAMFEEYSNEVALAKYLNSSVPVFENNRLTKEKIQTAFDRREEIAMNVEMLDDVQLKRQMNSIVPSTFLYWLPEGELEKNCGKHAVVLNAQPVKDTSGNQITKSNGEIQPCCNIQYDATYANTTDDVMSTMVYRINFWQMWNSDPNFKKLEEMNERKFYTDLFGMPNIDTNKALIDIMLSGIVGSALARVAVPETQEIFRQQTMDSSHEDEEATPIVSLKLAFLNLNLEQTIRKACYEVTFDYTCQHFADKNDGTAPALIRSSEESRNKDINRPESPIHLLDSMTAAVLADYSDGWQFFSLVNVVDAEMRQALKQMEPKAISTCLQGDEGSIQLQYRDDSKIEVIYALRQQGNFLL